MVRMTRYIQPQAQPTAAPPPALLPPLLIILVLFICLLHKSSNLQPQQQLPHLSCPQILTPVSVPASQSYHTDALESCCSRSPSQAQRHPPRPPVRHAAALHSLGDGLGSAGCQCKGNVFCARCWCGCMPLAACTRGHVSSRRQETQHAISAEL